MQRSTLPRLARVSRFLRSSSSSFSPLPPRTVTPQLAFAVGGSALALGGAAYYTNRDTDKRAAGFSFFGRRSTGLQPALARSRFEEVYDDARGFVKACGGNKLAVILAENWLEMSEAKRTGAELLASFAGVFLLWRVPGSSRFGHYLAHHPLSGKSVTLLTSVFSHRTLPHLAFNSIALYSFGTACFNYLNNSDELPRSTSRYEFLAFFVTAGLASSFASHFWFSRIVAGRLLRQHASPAVIRSTLLPSLGASGAVYGCVAMTALAFPETSVSLIFLPFFPIPIGAATGAMVAMDLTGLIAGWRMFDHAAHLAGAAAGALYWWKGHELFEKLRASMRSGEGRKKVQA
ncbi:hypothetical protein JCM8547_000542 [Rhodosporidiobolus lusitaniae]